MWLPLVSACPRDLNNPRLSWNYPETDIDRTRSRVFRDLWDKGYYLTSGGKFGGDYLVYPGRYTLAVVAAHIFPLISTYGTDAVAHDICSHNMLAYARSGEMPNCVPVGLWNALTAFSVNKICTIITSYTMMARVSIALAAHTCKKLLSLYQLLYRKVLQCAIANHPMKIHAANTLWRNTKNLNMPWNVSIEVMFAWNLFCEFRRLKKFLNLNSPPKGKQNTVFISSITIWQQT